MFDNKMEIGYVILLFRDKHRVDDVDDTVDALDIFLQQLGTLNRYFSIAAHFKTQRLLIKRHWWGIFKSS